MPPPGLGRKSAKAIGAWRWAVFALARSHAVRSGSDQSIRAMSTAIGCCPQPCSTRARRARRSWGLARRPSGAPGVYGLAVFWGGASDAARLCRRGLLRRQSARVARRRRGETEAWGSRPPRRSAAIWWESLRSFLAVPPCIARMSRAWPRTKGMPSSSQRSARQVPGEQALATEHAVLTGGAQRREAWVGIGAEVFVPAHLAVGLDDAAVQPVGVQVDAAVTRVLSRGNSPGSPPCCGVGGDTFRILGELQ